MPLCCSVSVDFAVFLSAIGMLCISISSESSPSSPFFISSVMLGFTPPSPPILPFFSHQITFLPPFLPAYSPSRVLSFTHLRNSANLFLGMPLCSPSPPHKTHGRSLLGSRKESPIPRLNPAKRNPSLGPKTLSPSR